MRLIDTHTHFHDPFWPGGIVWPKPGEAHHRPCLPETYRREVGPHPVVAVETSPRPQDDARLARLAAETPQIVAYINNLQPLAEGFADRLAASARDGKWRGIRLRPIDAFDLSSRQLRDALSRLEGLGHVELGIRHPARLEELRALCLALPGVRFVLTHAGHPRLRGAETGFGYGLLALENLHVKVSPPQGADFGDAELRTRYATHLERMCEYLPPSRFMYGSNWPVATAPARFTDWIRARFPQGIAEDMLWRNASGLYSVLDADCPSAARSARTLVPPANQSS